MEKIIADMRDGGRALCARRFAAVLARQNSLFDFLMSWLWRALPKLAAEHAGNRAGNSVAATATRRQRLVLDGGRLRKI
jgi:hypothetical protein